METGGEARPKSNPVLHYQIKQIKPLLSGSSRLGRALADLFSQLVKLCVGAPLRQVQTRLIIHVTVEGMVSDRDCKNPPNCKPGFRVWVLGLEIHTLFRLSP